MNLAEPARSVSPARASMAEASLSIQNEYKVEDAMNYDELHTVEAATIVEPAVTMDDPRQFAPTKELTEPHRTGATDISVEKLREGATGVSFEGTSGVCTGMTISGVRKVTLALSRILPALYDRRDFVSYGEITRYVAVKEDVLFVYAEKSDPNYLYSVPLGTLKPVKEDPKKPHNRSVTVSPGYGTGIDRQAVTMTNVLLLDANDKLAYQLAFDTLKDEGIADRFFLAVSNINHAEKKRENK